MIFWKFFSDSAGGGGGALQGFDPLPTQYINFEGGARAKKTQIFWSNFFKKRLKLLFWPVFSKFFQTKKGRQKFESFLKIPPPPPSRKS